MISAPVQILKNVHRRKLEKKRGKIQKKPKYFLTGCHGDDFQKVNNTNMIARMITNLAGKKGGKTKFP